MKVHELLNEAAKDWTDDERAAAAEHTKELKSLHGELAAAEKHYKNVKSREAGQAENSQSPDKIRRAREEVSHLEAKITKLEPKALSPKELASTQGKRQAGHSQSLADENKKRRKQTLSNRAGYAKNTTADERLKKRHRGFPADEYKKLDKDTRKAFRKKNKTGRSPY